MSLWPKELEERKRGCEHGFKTSLFLHWEVTEALPAHTRFNAILEQRQETRGSLNIPKLFKSLNGFGLMAETKVSSSYFNVRGTHEESQSSCRKYTFILYLNTLNLDC